MSVNLNLVVIQGRLVRDPEFKDFSTSKLCKFTVASNRVFKETKEVLFIDITAWGTLSNLCNQLELRKGDLVLVEGRLQQEKWTGKDGKESSKHSIVAQNVILIPIDGDGDMSSVPEKRNEPNINNLTF